MVTQLAMGRGRAPVHTPVVPALATSPLTEWVLIHRISRNPVSGLFFFFLTLTLDYLPLYEEKSFGPMQK